MYNLLCENPTFREKREEIKFNRDIWLSCKTYLSARKHHQHKYCDALLPERWNDEVIGHHSSCYKEFIVKSKYLSYERNVDQSSKSIHDESSNISALLNTVEESDVDDEFNIESFGDDDSAKK
ncbi:unnamed protein product [Psylliodes chrysocephalus]|uniref:Uncharacterized protein n=1 Tax=Psylliodes chrysocephalus TaxID=3402493 RepID=A0A9P0CVG4_9CUCU|nr:unnamed protein product [Psylliodes chrysocephala]